MVCVDLDINEPVVLLVIEKQDCVGSYVPSLGETFRVTATITDLNGAPVTGGTNAVTLYNPDGTANATSAAPTHTGGGVWTQNFTTLATDTEGGYLVVWINTTGAVVAIGKLKTYIDDPPIPGA